MSILKLRWLRWLFFLFALLLILSGVLIGLTPLTLQWLAEGWLHQQGLKGGIGSIELGLTQGRIQLNQVVVQSEDRGELQLGQLVLRLKLGAVFNNTLDIEHIAVSDLQIHSILENMQAIAIGGFALAPAGTDQVPDTQPPSQSWLLHLGGIELNNITSCMIDTLSRDRATLAAADPAELFSNSCLSVKNLHWQGSMEMDTDKPPRMAGSLAVADVLIKTLDAKRVLAGLETLSLDQFKLDHSRHVSAGMLQLSGFRLLQHPEGDDDYARFEDLVLRTPEIDLQTPLHITAHAVELSKVQLTEPHRANNINFVLEKLLLEKPHYTAGDTANISVDKTSLRNIQLLQHEHSEDYLIRLKQMNMLQTRLTTGPTQQLNIADISLDGLDATLQIQTDKSIVGLPARQQSTTAAQAESDPSFRLAIDRIKLNGQSQLHFIDRSVEPAIDILVADMSIELDNIESGLKDHASPIQARMRIGDHGRFTSQGTITLFAERPTLNIEQSLTGFDMAMINTYFKQYIGHRVLHGNLDINQDLVINQGQLDVRAQVLLRKFKIESLDSREAEQYQSELGIPLSSALNLLKDSDDNIRLELPITGDITAPDFSLKDIYHKVLGKAIKEAIINYYTPYGLVKLGTAIFNLATALRFDPVVFEPGQSSLNTEAENALVTLSQALKQKPQIDLIICSSPSLKDKTALFISTPQTAEAASMTDQQRGQLMELMNQRKKAVKNFLVEQMHIDHHRLIICNEPDESDWQNLPELEPRVILSL